VILRSRNKEELIAVKENPREHLDSMSGHDRKGIRQLHGVRITKEREPVG
jgi:hypothetical protein